jgi:tagatose 1,6-diphosphate aldolase
MSVLQTFLDIGTLSDGDLKLILAARIPADAAKGYVPAYRFEMFIEGHPSPVGEISLRLGDTDFLVLYGGQVAYRVDPLFRGRRLAARSCRLLLSLAKRHGLSPLWITCNPDNMPSRRTCELAGGLCVGIVDLPVDCDMYARGERQKCRYRFDV